MFSNLFTAWQHKTRIPFLVLLALPNTLPTCFHHSHLHEATISETEDLVYLKAECPQRKLTVTQEMKIRILNLKKIKTSSAVISKALNQRKWRCKGEKIEREANQVDCIHEWRDHDSADNLLRNETQDSFTISYEFTSNPSHGNDAGHLRKQSDPPVWGLGSKD